MCSNTKRSMVFLAGISITLGACAVDESWVEEHTAAVTYSDFRSPFTQLQGMALWPLQVSPDVTKVSSAFGPRLKVSGSEDFHRAIDISTNVGTKVVSILDDGVVALTGKSDGLGLYIYMKYELPTPVDFHGITATHIWTVYGHLDRIMVSPGDIIPNANTVIGKSGDTGNVVTPHLHFEVRLGKRCSMETQLLGGSVSDCRPPAGMEFDPHVDPMLLYVPPTTELRVLTCPSSYINDATSDLVAAWDSSTRKDIIPNRAEVKIKDVLGNVLDSHVLDDNLRDGYDASSETALDNWDKSVPHAGPVSYGTSASSYRMNLVVPSEWLYSQTQAARVEITLGDIWYSAGELVTLESCTVPVIAL